MKKYCCFALLAVLLFRTAPLHAQLTLERIAEDKYLVNGINYSYKPGNTVDTPAPRGYIPFYISHIGRHGSRFDLGEGRAFSQTVDILSEASGKGLLTSEGEAVLREVKLMKDKADGMYEMLTQRGCQEHQGISRRMQERFPNVFSSRQRDEVDAISSTVQRCIISMANFLLEIGREHPSMKITMDTGDTYMRYLIHWDGRNRSRQTTVDPDSKAWLQEHFNPERLFAAVFTDPAAAAGICEPLRFAQGLFRVMTFTETMGMEKETDLYRFFTPEERFALAADQSDRFFTENGPSLLYADSTALQGIRMLRDVVTKADAALASGSKRAADLRFTHDTAILPFATLLGFDGMDVRLPQTSAHESWYLGDWIPMGANFQLIFYQRKSSDDILVKMLFNEQERTFPSLEAVQGPYYRWNDLRDYFMGLLAGKTGKW